MLTTEAERNLESISDALFWPTAGDYMCPTFKTAIKRCTTGQRVKFFRKSIRKMSAPFANVWPPAT